MKVTIIGAGELGTALAKVLKKNAAVSLWDVDPKKFAHMTPLADAVHGAHVVFFAVPSFAMRQAVTEVLPYLDPSKTLIVSLAKGIERHSRKTMDEILRITLPKHSLWAVMGGPMLAAELTTGKDCAAVAAFSVTTPAMASAREDLLKIFRGTNLSLDISGDSHGVAVAGVLKNIYAVAMGIAAGLRWGADETAWLAARSMNEMILIGKRLGAVEATIRGTAGFADFLATAYSTSSRNRKSGYEMVAGDIPVVKGEGLLSLTSVLELLGPHATLFPVLATLSDVVRHNHSAKKSFDGLFWPNPDRIPTLP